MTADPRDLGIASNGTNAASSSLDIVASFDPDPLSYCPALGFCRPFWPFMILWAFLLFICIAHVCELSAAAPSASATNAEVTAGGHANRGTSARAVIGVYHFCHDDAFSVAFEGRFVLVVQIGLLFGSPNVGPCMPSTKRQRRSMWQIAMRETLPAMLKQQSLHVDRFDALIMNYKNKALRQRCCTSHNAL